MQIYIMITVQEKSEDYDDKNLKCLKRCIFSREHGDIELFGLSFFFRPTCPLNQGPELRQGLDGRLQAAIIPPGRHAYDTLARNFIPSLRVPRKLHSTTQHVLTAPGTRKRSRGLDLLTSSNSAGSIIKEPTLYKVISRNRHIVIAGQS